MVLYSSYYDILNVTEIASTEEIKTAFRKLALIHHPDKNSNSPKSETEFIIIYNAYNVLSNPVKRVEYDTYLSSSSILKNRKKGWHTGTKALPGIAKTPYSSLKTIFSHINFILWEIEDFLRNNNTIEWNKEYSGKPLLYYVLNILIFIDKWILDPSGYRDYFLEARKMNRTDIAVYINNIFFSHGKPGHRPFISIMDYFYNIRKRMDKFLKHCGIGDIVKTIPGCDIRIVDSIFEAQNLALHYICLLNKILAGETDIIPPFRHSNTCFDV